VALVVLLVLLLQPDGAQAAAFCAAWVGMAGVRRGWKATPVIMVSFLVAAACLLRRDPLEPVAHAEGIVGMAASQGSILAAAGLVSLVALPLAFVLFLERPVGIVLALYTVGTLIAGWLGNYPVPILGYGVSPVLGYYGAVVVCVLLYRPGGVLSSEGPSNRRRPGRGAIHSPTTATGGPRWPRERRDANRGAGAIRSSVGERRRRLRSVGAHVSA